MGGALSPLDECGDVRLVPVAVSRDAAETEALIEGIQRGGIGVVEIALRDSYAVTALERVAEHGALGVGAGTVLDGDQTRQAIASGARFLVSPGFSAEVVLVGADAGVPVLPGVQTPTDVLAARTLGLRHLKLLPARQAGGLALLGDYAHVFADVRFMPSGGVVEREVREYLRHPAVFAVSGSWVTSREHLRAGAAEVAAAAWRAVESARDVS